MAWENRIVGFDPAVAADQLLANPLNHRCHPSEQSAMLRAALDELGWVSAVTVNTVSGCVVDGHLRVGEAVAAGESVPVLYVELSEEEERKALAVFDAITDMATVDRDVLALNLSDLEFARRELADLTASLLGAPVVPPTGPGTPPSGNDNVLTWASVTWKKRSVDSTDSELALLDGAFEAYLARNDASPVGFVRALVEGRLDDE